MATTYPGNASYPPQHGSGAVSPTPPGGGAAGVPDSYFTESRKGEVNELRNLLRNFAVERDPQRKREIIKKVIAYMTLGIDVSRLFTEMMLAIETRDLVIKKMVYLYLCNYATTHPELAQMCTNTLQKDCGNDDPMVRGLALRALCSLNLPQMVEYISEPLRRSLTDGHAYVRKTGVMGILKLFYLDQEAFARCNFVDILYDMLRDPDASVVSNCILVLDEIMAKTPNGGMAINRAIMLHLLNRIHDFSQFGILQVLDLVPRYIPANEDEGLQIMNLLDPLLRTSNSGAVLATIRAFLSLTDQIGEDMETMKRQVVTRVKAPLITLIASGSTEMQYCLLKHVEALADMCPGIFDDEYRQLYVRYHEPTHIKYLKVDLLPRLVNPDNAPDIVAELAECVADVDITMSRLAVRSMTRIACRNVGGPGCAESIARRLVEMLDLNVEHVSSEAASALAHILRKHPSLKTTVAPPLTRTLKYTTEAAGKASIIYLLGECGDVVRDAPYALEKLIDTYDEITDAGVKIALLTSTVKLFFIRPPEVQKMLGRLLAKTTDDVTSQDLHDRALYYYRLFRSGTDPTIIESIVKTNAVVASGVNFSEEDDMELRADLMEEFNSLSILYGKTSENFIGDEHQIQYVRMPSEHPLQQQQQSSQVAPPSAVPPPSVPTPSVMDSYALTPPHPDPAALTHAATASTATPASADVMDLLGFGDTLPSPAAAPPPRPSTGGGISLSASATMTGDEYQAMWSAISDGDSIVQTIPLPRLPANTDQVESALARFNVMTMASGELPGEFKFFLYAKDQGSDIVFLVQSNVSKVDEPLLILTVKVHGGGGLLGSDQVLVDGLVKIISSALM